MPRTERAISPDERWWRFVHKTIGCWIWTGSKRGGYGFFHVNRHAAVAAHRFGYAMLVASIPDDITLDHLCRNRACVNPAHMDPVTQAVNAQRVYERPYGKEIDGNDVDGLPSGKPPSRLRTHCPKGHPYDEANTHVLKNGWRHCKECGRERGRARYVKRPARDRKTKACKYGHPWTEENSRIAPNGSRLCRTCRREWQRKRRAETGYSKGLGLPGTRTHCPRGHEYDAENTYVHKGSRHCRACRREDIAVKRKSVKACRP